MAVFFLDYDIRSRNHDYQPLYDELSRFNAVHILDSLWCFKRFNTSAASLRDHFGKFIHRDDSLCVSEVSDWATRNTLATPNDLS